MLPGIVVSLQELESAVSQLPADEPTAFARWFEEYLADVWDRRIEEDVKAGRLDEAGRRADADFDAKRCKPQGRRSAKLEANEISDDRA